MAPPASEDASSAPTLALSSESASLSRERAARTHSFAAMSTAAVLFALMGAFTKLATRPSPHLPNLPGAELAICRYLFGLAFLLVVARWRGVSLLGEDRRGLLWRGVSGGIANTCYFLGIQYTALTRAMLLNYTAVIWGPLMAVFALREPLGRRGTLAVLGALCGVLFVTRPESGTIRTGDLIALFSGIMAGSALVQIRRLRQGETSYAIFFYFNLLGIPIALASTRLVPARFVVPALSQIPLLLAIGATSVGGQLLMTYGYKEMTAAQGSLISLTSVVFSALLANLLFAEPLTPSTLLGGTLILLSATGLILDPARKAHRQAR